MAGGTMYFATDMLTKLFIDKAFTLNTDIELTFRDLTTINEFWQYVEIVVINNVYEPSADEGHSSARSYTNETMIHNKFVRIQNESIYLGPPRLRQLKVVANSCNVHKLFQRFFQYCFSPFSLWAEDRSTDDRFEGTA